MSEVSDFSILAYMRQAVHEFAQKKQELNFGYSETDKEDYERWCNMKDWAEFENRALWFISQMWNTLDTDEEI